MINDNQITEEMDANDGWRVELDSGTTVETLWLVLRKGSVEQQRHQLYETDQTIEPNSPGVTVLFYFCQAVARALNCGIPLSVVQGWLQAWPSEAEQQVLPNDYRLAGTVEQSTRQYFYSTPNGVRVVTEDEFAETVDEGTLLSRIENELVPYDDLLDSA